MENPPSSSSPAPKSFGLSLFFKLWIFSKTPEGQLLRIQLSVLATTVMLFLLFYLGNIRRRVRAGSKRKYLIKIIYILIPISITYIMGLMHNASTFHVFYPFWACALLYAYGGVFTMTACEFSDNEDAHTYVWRTIPLFVLTGWLIVLLIYHKETRTITHDHTLWTFVEISFVIFLLAAILNTRETIAAFNQASKSKGLPFKVEPTVRYMREGRDIPDEVVDVNTLPMTRYRYLVWGNPTDESGFITTEEIWQYVGTDFLVDCAGKEQLKDLCLSYALFRLILRRFAGLPLYESSEPKTRNFIQEGLLPMDLERVFRIIEVELQFLFDFFYTKSHIYDYSFSLSMWYGYVYANLVMWLAYAYIAFPQLISSEQKDQGKLFTIQFHGHSLEVMVTRIVLIILSLLEVWKVIDSGFSNRRMVWLLGEACTHHITQTHTWFRTILRQIGLCWKVRDWFSRTYLFGFLFKPWRRQLGQYSFIDTEVPKLAYYHFFGLSRISRARQVGEFSVDLSIQVKQTIVKSLLELLQEAPNDQPVRLSRGRATISRYSLSEQISSACELETDADVILVWHIATELCADDVHENNYPNFPIATQLSKYCAYLVTFAPELLPDHPFITESRFHIAVQQAMKVVLMDLNQPELNENVINMDDVLDPDKVVALGIALARRLIDEVIGPNPEQGWKFLTEFWAELLLYLAPSDNVAIHGEYLTKGGEFITHLWALLTHAGIVTPSINCPPM